MALKKETLEEEGRRDSEEIAEFLRGKPLDARMLCRVMLAAYVSGTKDALRSMGVTGIQNPTAAGQGKV